MNTRANTSRVANVNEGSSIGFYDLYSHPQRRAEEIKVIDRYEFVFLKLSNKKQSI